MSSATVGRAREHKVRNDMVKYGWRQVMRAAGSKGSADLLMVCPHRGFALVQVGGEDKRLGPLERARLLADADDGGALAIIANVIPRQGIDYRQVVFGLPATWPVWHPREENWSPIDLDEERLRRHITDINDPEGRL